VGAVFYHASWATVRECLGKILTFRYFGGAVVGYFWSISTEFQFYALAPLAAFVLFRVAKSQKLFGGILAGSLGCSLMYLIHLISKYDNSHRDYIFW
jgi:peptidoglycan/LPS O-acetylase OafA/YrhL